MDELRQDEKITGIGAGFMCRGVFKHVEVGEVFEGKDGNVYMKVNKDFAVAMTSARFFHPGHSVKTGS